MTPNKLGVTKRELLDHLMAVAQELPLEKIVAVSDYARDLRVQTGSQPPMRGSAVALLQALDDIGPLQFEADELEMLLVEIEHLRDLDMEEDG